jgi:hypothetical protein
MILLTYLFANVLIVPIGKFYSGIYYFLRLKLYNFIIRS